MESREREEALAGGNMSTVSRVGMTVRRQAGPWTPQVHRLLAHLRARGIDEVPAPLGFDAQGREMLTYIPGTVGHRPLPALQTDEVLVAAAHLLRQIHDATVEVAQQWPSGWQAPSRPPIEVICHGDFAPYNLVFEAGKLVGVIDFDHAHPGPRAWDLAYALYRIAPIMASSNPDSFGSVQDQCRRVRLFCDTYGAQNRAHLVPTIRARIAFMADFLRRGAAEGDARMQENIDAGHLAVYTTDAAYFDAHCDEFRLALE